MEYVVVSAKDFNEARRKIRENKLKEKKEIVFTSNDDELNRKVLEKEAIDTLLISQKGRKDKLKQRDSGFNQVLAKIAKKKNIIIGINLDEILSPGSLEEKAEILARIQQNVVLCNKNKLKMKFISTEAKARSKHDLKALGLVLGMPTWMNKEI